MFTSKVYGPGLLCLKAIERFTDAFVSRWQRLKWIIQTEILHMQIFLKLEPDTQELI